MIQSAIEDYAQELALVVRRFLKAKAWAGTERIVMGGGFRESRIGELAIARANLILKADGIKVDMVPIHNDPDEAALIGSLHLAPAWIFKGHDSILAIDIGGTNIRAGVVLPNVGKASDLTKASVWKSEKWRHADEEKLNARAGGRRADRHAEGPDQAREEGRLQPRAVHRHRVPRQDRGGRRHRQGRAEPAGQLGEQPLQSAGAARRGDSRRSATTTSTILMHNDAVVQGLSEVPFMRDVKRWGVLTIGTGLGNARFTNRQNGKG